MKVYKNIGWMSFLGLVVLITSSSLPQGKWPVPEPSTKGAALAGRNTENNLECPPDGGHDIAVPAEAPHEEDVLNKARTNFSVMPASFKRYENLNNNLAFLTTAAAGCTKLVITAPQTLAVGIQVKRDGRYVFETNPKDHQLSGLIRVFQNGRPFPNATVELWVTAGGQWQKAGQGPGHDHIKEGSAPSVKLIDYSSRGAAEVLKPGQKLRGITNSQGEFKYGLEPGYRGGPERLWARWVNAPAGADSSYGATIFVRYGNLVDFGLIHNFSAKRQPVSSPGFPYVLVGWTDRHLYSNYVQPQLVPEFDRAMIRFWESSLTPAEKAISIKEPRSSAAHWLLLNDMSLEYGGIFKVNSGRCEDPHEASGHASHNKGIDIDVAPCFSNGTTRVYGAECDPRNPKYKVINRDALEAMVSKQSGWWLLVHLHKGYPTGVDHYHIRMKGNR